MVQYKSAISITVLVLIALFSGCTGVQDITPINKSASNSTATTTPIFIPTSTITPTPTLTAIMTPNGSPTSTVTPTPQTTPVATTVSTIPVPVADQKTLTNSIGMEFILIPAGEFDMGSPLNEKYRESSEGPVHRVKLTSAFYMGKYEVTQKQWREIMGNSPSYFKGDDLPVEQVSWNDAQEFIKKLNEKESTVKYRLPSEAEWEYAARAGTTTIYSFGDYDFELGDYGWYKKNTNDTTHPVGLKKPNPWGLYDMHCNVWEWVQDKFYGNYIGAPADGSAWESGNYTTHRVERGGGWRMGASDCRSAMRIADPPNGRFIGLGFRLVRDL